MNRRLLTIACPTSSLVRNMSRNTKHYRKGSEEPKLPDDGIYRLYSMRFCPYAARTHLMLDAKDIPYHTINVYLFDKPEWLFAANPLGKVPALQLVDKPNAPFIYESLLIAEYLDEVHPKNKLYPTDPLQKVQEKQWLERFNSIIGAFYRLAYRNKSDEDKQTLLETFYKNLADFETELITRKTPYFAGAKPGILDYGIWPWFECFGILSSIVGEKYNFNERFPKLTEWMLLLQVDDAVKKHFVSTSVHYKLSREFIAGNPNYDLLVEKA